MEILSHYGNNRDFRDVMGEIASGSTREYSQRKGQIARRECP